jgi:hypothetical protein
MTARFRRTPRLRRPPLDEYQILAWADAHQERTGEWPIVYSGLVPDAPRETWINIDQALRKGLRGLEEGSSLARLLALHRGARNHRDLPPLTVEQILTWADAHHIRTGQWPIADSGPIADAPRDTWMGVDVALTQGHRSLPGGSSLARLLAEHRAVRNNSALPPLQEAQILSWADAHFRQRGEWPIAESGSIGDAPGETWAATDQALKRGSRGLPGGSSLARLLDSDRGVRNRMDLPALAEEQILAWADAYRARTGQWPKRDSGPIDDALEETWASVNAALIKGSRGLLGGSSLPRLLAAQRGVRNQATLPEYSVPRILAWADAYYERHGAWPQRGSGPIEEAPGETWRAVDSALRNALRGLPGGSSLARLILEHGTAGPSPPAVPPGPAGADTG